MRNVHHVQEFAKIVGSDGAFVGTVQRVEGDSIKVVCIDDRPTDYIHVALVDCVENGVVWLREKGAQMLPE